MSSFGRVSKDLLKERFKIVSLVFGMQILVTAATLLWKFFDHSAEVTSYSGSVAVFLVIPITFMAVMNERVLVNDRYRLIPISDNTFYSSVTLTALASLVYIIVGELIIYLGFYKLFPNPYDQMMINDFNSVQQYLFKFEVLVAFILGIMVVWTGITALHLLVNWVNDFLPFKGQNISKVIVAIVVIWAFMVPFNFITGNTLRIMGINDLDNSFNAVTHMMYASMGMMLIWIVIFSAINLYLLNKKSETTI